MDMYTLKQIPSEAQIRKYIRRSVYGKNMYCPECKSSHVYTDQARYRCRRCRTRFSLTSHTWLNNMKLSLPQFWLLLYCWTIQIPVRQAHKLCELSEVSIYEWYTKFRRHVPADQKILEIKIESHRHSWPAIVISHRLGLWLWSDLRKSRWRELYTILNSWNNFHDHII